MLGEGSRKEARGPKPGEHDHGWFMWQKELEDVGSATTIEINSLEDKGTCTNLYTSLCFPRSLPFSANFPGYPCYNYFWYNVGMYLHSLMIVGTMYLCPHSGFSPASTGSPKTVSRTWTAPHLPWGLFLHNKTISVCPQQVYNHSHRCHRNKTQAHMYVFQTFIRRDGQLWDMLRQFTGSRGEKLSLPRLL